MPSKNVLVDNVESEVRDLRRVYDLSHILFVFPSAKFESDDGWSDTSGLFSGLLARVETKRDVPFDRPVTLEVNGMLHGLEVEVSSADSRRLANWAILTLRRRKKGYAISFSPRIRGLLNSNVSFGVVSIPRFWEGSSVNIHIVQALQDTSRELSEVKLPRNYWLTTSGDVLEELEETDEIGPHRNDVKLALLERQGWKCNNCGNSLRFSGSEINQQLPKMLDSRLRLPAAPARPATVDHSLPKKATGSNRLSNYRAVCLACNREKASDLPYGLTATDSCEVDGFPKSFDKSELV